MTKGRVTGNVFVHGYAAQCRIGCNETERQAEQPILIDIVCETDMLEAVTSDNRCNCVDYCALQQVAEQCSNATAYHLLECLAYKIAQELLNLPRIEAATVTIRKPYKLSGVQDVGISLTLSRSQLLYMPSAL